MRLPIASSIETRDGTLAKDAKLVNCFVDVEGETSFVVKRPGLRKSVASAAGTGLGMVSWEGNMYHAVGSTFYQTSYASIPSGGSSSPSVSVSMAYDPTATSFVLIGAICFGGGYMWNVYSYPGVAIQTRKSSDNGSTWSAITNDSNGNSLAIETSRLFYVSGSLVLISNGSVYSSSNFGASWDLVQGVQAVTGAFPVIHDGTRFVSLKTNGVGTPGVYTSTDGISWTFVASLPLSLGALPDPYDAIFHDGKYYVTNSNANKVSISEDLVTWNHFVTDTGGTAYTPSFASDGSYLLLLAQFTINQYSIKVVDTGNVSFGNIVYTFQYPYFYTGRAGYGITARIGTDIYHVISNQEYGRAIAKISVSGGQSYATPPYSYAFTTATPGLPLSWVGTSPGTYTKKMFIKNEEKAWTLTLGTPGTLTQVTDPDYPAATVPGAVYLDGYFFVMDKDGTVYNCDLENPDSWNALNYITAEAEWDKGVAIAKHQNYVVALKDWTCELFYDAANPTGSPLSKVSNATVQIGCAQGYSVVQFHGGLIFMSKTRERGRSVHFFPPNSIDPQEIASASIQRILNAADLTTVRAWGGKLGGRILYVLNLVTANITLVYDFTSKTWAQWTSDNAGTEGYFKYGFYATDGNRDFLLHETTGEVFTLTPDVYQDDGADIKVLIRTGRLDAGNMDRKTMSQLTIVGDESATSVSVQQSDDDYQTFSTARTVAMDAEPPRLLRLGMFRRRSFDIRHVDNTPLRLTAIDAEIQQAR